jgi:PEP-CTERM motif
LPAAALGSTGWSHDVTYSFDVTYASNSLIVYVDTGSGPMMEFDLEPADVGLGAFPSGSFALFNHSQAQALYSYVVPEPKTFVLMALCLGLVVWMQRRAVLARGTIS